jgi:hypothetical protein
MNLPIFPIFLSPPGLDKVEAKPTNAPPPKYQRERRGTMQSILKFSKIEMVRNCDSNSNSDE